MLKRRALTATIWSGSELVLRQGIQFLSTILLARLLTPADFGLVAMLALFTGVAMALLDGGFSAALIQRQDVDHADESTVFWCNLGIGGLLAGTLYVTAPAIAAFYGRAELELLTRVMGLVVLLSALGAIHSTLLTKQLDFRAQAKAGVLASVTSGLIAIAMAWYGFGVWALAGQAIAMAACLSFLLWWFNPWRPAWIFSVGSVRKLFAFGGYHLGSILLEVMYAKIYTLLVGRLFGARELGWYNNAETTRQLPTGFFGGLLARVALPMFSAAAGDLVLLRRGVQLSIRGLMLVNAPIMLGMAVLAKPLTLALFGDQWLPAVPILQVLCLVGVLFPLHAINLYALMAQGRSGLMFKLEVAKKTIGIAMILTGATFGVMGIAWSQVVFSVVALAINTHYTRRHLDYGLFKQLRDVLPSFGVAVVMCVVVYAVQQLWPQPPWRTLLISATAGASTFLALAWLVRLDALADVVILFRQPPAANAGGVA